MNLSGNLSGNLARIIEQHPADNVALISRGRATTYGTLREQVASLRGALRDQGVMPGDAVVLLCGNSRYFVVSYLAVLGVGAVAVPLNHTSPAPEIEHEIMAVKASVVILEPSAISAWRAMPVNVVASVRFVLATEGHDLAGVHTVDEYLSHTPAPIVDVAPDAPAVYIFTSGTAGSPKAAVLTHRNLLANIEQVGAVEELRSSDVFYGVLPLFHIFGLNVVLGTALAAGACVVLVQRFDPVTAVETFRERGVTVVPGAPGMWVALAQLPGLTAADFAGVRLALTGASKMPEDVAIAMRDKFNVLVQEGYGLTEASPVVTTSIGAQWRPGSIGVPLKGIEIRLVDEDGSDAREGDSGELWVRGENVFVGYLDDKEATDRVLTSDGWLRTGDIATVDDDGRLYLVDRAKDLIIVSGFNVYPAEVEAAIATHPGVAEVAVVGTPHPHTGESVRAYVVQKPGVHLDEDVLIEYCRTKVARYKCPSKILFVDQLPHNFTGKLQRFALR